MIKIDSDNSDLRGYVVLVEYDSNYNYVDLYGAGFYGPEYWNLVVLTYSYLWPQAAFVRLYLPAVNVSPSTNPGTVWFDHLYFGAPVVDPDPVYDSGLDYNHDDVINIMDIQYMASQWGQWWYSTSPNAVSTQSAIEWQNAATYPAEDEALIFIRGNRNGRSITARLVRSSGFR